MTAPWEIFTKSALGLLLKSKVQSTSRELQVDCWWGLSPPSCYLATEINIWHCMWSLCFLYCETFWVRHWLSLMDIWVSSPAKKLNRRDEHLGQYQKTSCLMRTWKQWPHKQHTTSWQSKRKSERPKDISCSSMLYQDVIMWYSVSLIWSRQKESFPTNTKRCEQLSVSGLFLKSRKHQRRDCQCRRMIHSSTVWCVEDSVTRQIPLHCLHSCYWKDITVVIIQNGVFTSHKCCSKAAFVQNIFYYSAVAGEYFQSHRMGMDSYWRHSCSSWNGSTCGPRMPA